MLSHNRWCSMGKAEAVPRQPRIILRFEYLESEWDETVFEPLGESFELRVGLGLPTNLTIELLEDFLGMGGEFSIDFNRLADSYEEVPGSFAWDSIPCNFSM